MAQWTALAVSGEIAEILRMQDHRFSSLGNRPYIWMKTREVSTEGGDQRTEVRYYTGLFYSTVIIKSVECGDFWRHETLSLSFRFFDKECGKRIRISIEGEEKISLIVSLNRGLSKKEPRRWVNKGQLADTRRRGKEAVMLLLKALDDLGD